MIRRWFGKGLEITGRIIRADGFDNWIEGQLEKIAEDLVVEAGAKAVGGRDELKRSFLKAFKMPLKEGPFAEKINRTFQEFLDVGGEICELIVRATSISSNQVFLVPFFVMNPGGFHVVEAQLSGSADFKRLYPEPNLKKFFFNEWERAIVNKILEANPTVKKPLRLGSKKKIDEYFIVFVDKDAFWSDKQARGSYYIYYGPNAEQKSFKPKIQKRIEDLDNLRGQADQATIDCALTTYSTLVGEIGDKPNWHNIRMSMIDKSLKLPFRVGSWLPEP
jgi:hypothetical protein